jgi:hypothetical protein
MAGVAAKAVAATAIPRAIFLMGPPSQSGAHLSQRSCQFFNIKITNCSGAAASSNPQRSFCFDFLNRRDAECSSNIAISSGFCLEMVARPSPVAEISRPLLHLTLLPAEAMPLAADRPSSGLMPDNTP